MSIEPTKPTLSSHDLARMLVSHRDNDVMVSVVDADDADQRRVTVQPYAVAYNPTSDQVEIIARRHFAPEAR